MYHLVNFVMEKSHNVHIVNPHASLPKQQITPWIS